MIHFTFTQITAKCDHYKYSESWQFQRRKGALIWSTFAQECMQHIPSILTSGGSDTCWRKSAERLQQGSSKDPVGEDLSPAKEGERFSSHPQWQWFSGQSCLPNQSKELCKGLLHLRITECTPRPSVFY